MCKCWILSILSNKCLHLNISFEIIKSITIYICCGCTDAKEVHSYKKIIYDRVDDADVKVTSTSQIAAMYIRKQNIFTEKKIYHYVTLDDLRLDLLPRVRQMAVNHAMGVHP